MSRGADSADILVRGRVTDKPLNSAAERFYRILPYPLPYRGGLLNVAQSRELPLQRALVESVRSSLRLTRAPRHYGACAGNDEERKDDDDVGKFTHPMRPPRCSAPAAGRAEGSYGLCKLPSHRAHQRLSLNAGGQGVSYQAEHRLLLMKRFPRRLR